MKKLNVSQMEKIEGGKFFGATSSCGACNFGERVCVQKYYVFWLKVSEGIYFEEC
jgi:hypothetical protein